MSDSLLKRYIKDVPASHEPTHLALVEDEQEVSDDCGAFGFLRGTRDRAIMLELRKKDGNIRAVGYAWLSLMEFDPSIGIILHLANQKIRIFGRNLNGEHRPNVRLFQGILRHRVPWLQEADEPSLMQSGDHEAVIEKIEW